MYDKATWKIPCYGTFVRVCMLKTEGQKIEVESLWTDLRDNVRWPVATPLTDAGLFAS